METTAYRIAIEVSEMEKVIVSIDWWDDPKTGLAYYNGQVCIYDRVFNYELDDYTDEYDLLPISDEEKDCILNECKRLDTELREMGLAAWQEKSRLTELPVVNSLSVKFSKETPQEEWLARREDSQAKPFMKMATRPKMPMSNGAINSSLTAQL